MSLTCPVCYMVFNSQGLLQKHRIHFCVGDSRDMPRLNLRQRSPSPEYRLTNRRPLGIVSPVRATNYSPQSNASSMSIHLPPSDDGNSYLSPDYQYSIQEDDDFHGNPERENRHRELLQQANLHGRQLAQYQSKSRSLELQKDEIDRRLRQLGTDGMPSSHTHHTTLDMQQLRDQEAKNQRALRELRSQVQGLSVDRLEKLKRVYEDEEDLEEMQREINDRNWGKVTKDLLHSVNVPAGQLCQVQDPPGLAVPGGVDARAGLAVPGGVDATAGLAVPGGVDDGCNQMSLGLRGQAGADVDLAQLTEQLDQALQILNKAKIPVRPRLQDVAVAGEDDQLLSKSSAGLEDESEVSVQPQLSATQQPGEAEPDLTWRVPELANSGSLTEKLSNVPQRPAPDYLKSKFEDRGKLFVQKWAMDDPELTFTPSDLSLDVLSGEVKSSINIIEEDDNEVNIPDKQATERENMRNDIFSESVMSQKSSVIRVQPPSSVRKPPSSMPKPQTLQPPSSMQKSEQGHSLSRSERMDDQFAEALMNIQRTIASSQQDGRNKQQLSKKQGMNKYNKLLHRTLSLIPEKKFRNHGDVDSDDETLPHSSNTAFLAEIIALRQMYLSQGGNHTSILSQIAQLEAEARRMSLDDKVTPRRKDKKFESLNEQMGSIEMENERLQRELLDMQDRNNRLLNNRANGYMDDVEAERLRSKHENYRGRLEELENEIELLRRQAKLSTLKKELQTPKEAPPLVYEQTAEVPALIQPTYNPGYMDMDNLPHGPYDPNMGFMVFYDFITGLDPSVQASRLVVSLYNNAAQYGQPSVLPTVPVDGSTGYDTRRPGMFGNAVVRAKQPVPRCPPAPDLSLVAELQVATPGGQLSTRGWCKLDLFDNASQLISGRFRVPLRILPIKPNSTSLEFNSVPQYGVAELYVRIVNARDADIQSMVNVGLQNAHKYQYPPQITRPVQTVTVSRYDVPSPSKPAVPHVMSIPRRLSTPPVSQPQPQVHSYPHHYVPPPPSVSPPESPEPVSTRSRHREQDYDTESRTIGFQVVSVKNADPGEGKIRLTAYYKSNSHIVQSDNSPVTASTNAVKSNFKHKYHVFGRQEAMFDNVELRPDVILVVRFYLQKRAAQEFDDPVVALRQDGRTDDKDLVAWGFLPLMSTKSRGLASGLSDYRIRVGSHSLRLYEAPVPEVGTLPLDGSQRWHRYNNARARIHIFVDKPQAGSLTPSEESDIEDDLCPQYAWLPHERPEYPSEPFSTADGFDLYIDGCLNLPDSVTFTRVAGRLLSRKYERVGTDLNTSVRLDSDIYNPVYDYRVELREPNMPATTTLLIKVYTIDRFSKKLTVAGYATLNVFVETGTDQQPIADTPGVQLSLNEGCHQLRLYQRGPDGVESLYRDCLLDKGIRHVPCATVLVRLFKAAKGPTGKVLQAEKVPQADWVKLGLFRKRPHYHDQVYQSISCKPTQGEGYLYLAQLNRTPVSLKESLQMILAAEDMRRIRTDQEVGDYIKNQLTRMMDVTPVDIDLTYISQYIPKWGLKFVVDKAMNLSWSNFTHAHFCLNPPGAFYQGQPFGAYDKLMFTEKLEQNSTNKSPAWKDAVKHLPYRAYHKYLTMIVHLQEVQVIVSTDSYKYGLLDQAWTAVPLFSQGYAHTSAYQLPLFHGCPTPQILKQLAQQPVLDWIKLGLSRDNLKLVEGASVFVRVADGRRDDELPISIPRTNDVDINKELLPSGRHMDYTTEEDGRSLYRLVPPGKEPNEFFLGLGTKFKSLVYKLYEEGHVGTR